MKLFDAFRINIKKLQFRTSKALFLIIPITFLVALSIIISSQVKNFQTATDESIFGEIEEESTVLEVVYQVESSGDFRQMFMQENKFTETELATIKSIDSVSNASMNYSIPIRTITTSDLFSEKTMSFGEIIALDESMAGLYTTEEFTYTEGEAVPIILNANSFIERYEDWGGQDEFTVDMRAARDSREDIHSITPMKSRAIEYGKDDLIGKKFDITFGGLDDVGNFEVERDMGVVTFTKLTEDEIAERENARKESIGTYWNYDAIAEGITYTFKVVGVIESEDSRATYVPEDFASTVMADYIDSQLASRTDTELPNDLLDATYTGLTYDGTELSSGFGGGMGSGFGRPHQLMGDNESYSIPGLVIEVSEEDSNEVLGIYDDTEVFDDAVKTGDTISIKINSIFDRNQVVDDLNSLGYAYQDVNKLDVFENLQKTLNQVSVGVIIAFIVLTIAVIILTMSKFVSESTKEIGIFRAVGFTKGNILTIFLSQSLLFTAVGYLLGVLIGTAGNVGVSSFMGNWFDSLVTNTIRESYNVVNDVDYSIFTGLDVVSIGILSAILLIVTIVISFIPAIKASNVSPVEAIKNE